MKLGKKPFIDPSASVEDSSLGPWTYVSARSSVTESVIGDYSYVMNDSSIIYAEVGKFCSIAAHTRINPVNHPLWRPTLHHFTYRSMNYGMGDDDETVFNWRRSQKVTIGHDVWIGHGAILLPGVSIGTGAVVGAGAVVSKDVAPFTIVAGVPAKPIRRRLDEQVGSEMMRIAWWDWPEEMLRRALNDFRDLSVDQFVRKHRRNAEKVRNELYSYSDAFQLRDCLEACLAR